MFSHFKSFTLSVALVLASALFIDPQEDKTQEKPKKEEKPKPQQQQTVDIKNATAEQNAGEAEEPVERLAHHAGGSHGRQEAEEPEWEQDAQSQGVHGVERSGGWCAGINWRDA